jgi:hypothetical protein
MGTTCHAGYRRSFANWQADGIVFGTMLIPSRGEGTALPFPTMPSQIATPTSPPTMADPGACWTMPPLIVEYFQTGGIQHVTPIVGSCRLG